MKAILLNSKRHTFAWNSIHLIGEAIGDAALFGICGALYGFIFHGIGAMGSRDVLGIFVIAGTYAFYGCAIGMVVGIFREVVQAWKVRRLSSKDGMGETAQRPIIPVGSKPSEADAISHFSRHSTPQEMKRVNEKFELRMMSHSWRQFRDEITDQDDQRVKLIQH